MGSDSSIKRSVTTAQAIKMLADEGLEIKEKEAEEILDLLYFLGKLTVNQLVNNKGNTGRQTTKRVRLNKTRERINKT
jgi:hypothetical protein